GAGRGRGRGRGRGAAFPAAAMSIVPAQEIIGPDGKRESVYRGVYWEEKLNQWRAETTENGGTTVLGYFATQEDAARAFDAAILRSGNKELLNFPLLAKPASNPHPGPKARGPRAPGTRVTSQYKGVSWNSACSKWVAVLWDRELKRARHIGSYESEEDAARAYDKEALRMLGPEAGLNFRESAADYLAEIGADGVPEGTHNSNKGSSQYRGVSWHERSQRWEVRVWGGGKQHFIGSFTEEVEAARAYDRAVLRLRGQDARSRSRMNFPLSDYNLDELGVAGDPSVFLGLAVGMRATPEPRGRKPGRRKRPRGDGDDSDSEEEPLPIRGHQSYGASLQAAPAAQLQLQAATTNLPPGVAATSRAAQQQLTAVLQAALKQSNLQLQLGSGISSAAGTAPATVPGTSSGNAEGDPQTRALAALTAAAAAGGLVVPLPGVPGGAVVLGMLPQLAGGTTAGGKQSQQLSLELLARHASALMTNKQQGVQGAGGAVGPQQNAVPGMLDGQQGMPEGQHISGAGLNAGAGASVGMPSCTGSPSSAQIPHQHQQDTVFHGGDQLHPQGQGAGACGVVGIGQSNSLDAFGTAACQLAASVPYTTASGSAGPWQPEGHMGGASGSPHASGNNNNASRSLPSSSVGGDDEQCRMPQAGAMHSTDAGQRAHHLSKQEHRGAQSMLYGLGQPAHTSVSIPGVVALAVNRPTHPSSMSGVPDLENQLDHKFGASVRERFALSRSHPLYGGTVCNKRVGMLDAQGALDGEIDSSSGGADDDGSPAYKRCRSDYCGSALDCDDDIDRDCGGIGSRAEAPSQGVESAYDSAEHYADRWGYNAPLAGANMSWCEEWGQRMGRGRSGYPDKGFEER
ncbi:hypothetical protein VaNZ11_007199, partial [Volvox africanus]